PRADRLTATLARRRRAARRALLCAGILCAGVAALQPLLGYERRVVEQRGVDLVVCVDVSRSMLARDVAPSRLLAAREHVRALAERARGDRLALVAFAGEAHLVVPLTQDVDSLLAMLDTVDPLAVRRGGTDLGAALQRALDALHQATGDAEAVSLVTDGEDHEQRGLRLAETFRARGVPVHCVGLGSPHGSKIAVEGDGGEAFLRDRAGNEVVSALDVASLRALATATGGEFVDAGSGGSPLVELYDRRIVPMAQKALAREQRRERSNRFQAPLLLAVVLWAFALLLGERAAADAGLRAARRA